MKRAADRDASRQRRNAALSASALAVFHAIVRFPFKVVATLLKRTAQALLSIFIVILHPSFKWLVTVLARSSVVRNYISPAIQGLISRYYEPYFVFLRSLPPYWATFSIALPLAALEPAKLYATILIAERPKAGILLWLFLQGLSFVLIDKTWTAVRPQSRKIWLVSRLHAWGWLNVAYGTYWIKTSVVYRTIIRWQKRIGVNAQAFWARLLTLRHGRRR
jgi:hypothetical protein